MTCPSCLYENEPLARICKQCGLDFDTTSTSILVSVDLSPGSVFAGRYEIVRMLGRGGMGMVFLARDRTLDELVAIKFLRPDYADNSAMAARFKSEIKVARRIRHRNVGAIHDFGEHQKLLYISMEYIEGVDLKQLIMKNGAFAPAEAYELSIQIAEGLQAVHDAGVVHRDLKTPNIMRDAKGEARLMDFGIAKVVGSDGGTGTGNVVGTPEYMSPEQAKGEPLDGRSDIYALGIVMYELFSGEVPFRASTPIAVIFKHLQEPPLLEGPGAPSLPPALVPVLRKCLEKEPGSRFATARDVAEALRQARTSSPAQLSGTRVLSSAAAAAPRPTAVSGPTTVSRGVTGTTRRAGASRTWLVALPVMVLLVAGGFALWSRQQPAAEGPSADLSTPTSAPAAAAATATADPTAGTPEPATPTPTPERTLPPVAVPTAKTEKPTRTAAPTRAAATTAAPTATATAAATAAPTSAPAETGTGLLHVVVVPWADVIIDGQFAGTTPMGEISLKAGTHQVTLRYPTYESVQRSIVIKPGATERLRFNFIKDGTRSP